MKKSTLKSLVAYLNGEVVTNIDEIKAELEAEYAKGEAKAQANREAYALAHDVVMNAINGKALTVKEIVAACEGELPEGFSASKVQYGLLNYWNTEIEKIENAKGQPNQYRKV